MFLLIGPGARPDCGAVPDVYPGTSQCPRSGWCGRERGKQDGGAVRVLGAATATVRKAIVTYCAWEHELAGEALSLSVVTNDRIYIYIYINILYVYTYVHTYMYVWMAVCIHVYTDRLYIYIMVAMYTYIVMYI